MQEYIMLALRLSKSVFEIAYTGPKLRFLTRPAYQNMTFPHISNTSWQRIGRNFMQTRVAITVHKRKSIIFKRLFLGYI